MVLLTNPKRSPPIMTVPPPFTPLASMVFAPKSPTWLPESTTVPPVVPTLPDTLMTACVRLTVPTAPPSTTTKPL